MTQANGSRGGQRLYSEGVMFNAMLAPLSLGVAKKYEGKMDVFYNIYDHDPLVNRTAGDSLLVKSLSHAQTRWKRGNQCMVSSGINDVYQRVREELKTEYRADFNFRDGKWIDPNKKYELMHKAKCFLYEQCHFVGFARGEVKYPLEDKDKFREGQVAVNCGGNVTIKADEPIATGDYVVIDFESDLLFESEEKFNQIINSKRHSLKVKSFTKSAKEAIHAALEMKKVASSIEVQTIRDAFSKGAAQVIGQCKSGCLLSNEMIDVKLDVKIDKRSYDLLAMLDQVTKESIDDLKTKIIGGGGGGSGGGASGSGRGGGGGGAGGGKDSTADPKSSAADEKDTRGENSKGASSTKEPAPSDASLSFPSAPQTPRSERAPFYDAQIPDDEMEQMMNNLRNELGAVVNDLEDVMDKIPYRDLTAFEEMALQDGRFEKTGSLRAFMLSRPPMWYSVTYKNELTDTELQTAQFSKTQIKLHRLMMQQHAKDNEILPSFFGSDGAGLPKQFDSDTKQELRNIILEGEVDGRLDALWEMGLGPQLLVDTHCFDFNEAEKDKLFAAGSHIENKEKLYHEALGKEEYDNDWNLMRLWWLVHLVGMRSDRWQEDEEKLKYFDRTKRYAQDPNDKEEVAKLAYELLAEQAPRPSKSTEAPPNRSAAAAAKASSKRKKGGNSKPTK